MNIHGIIVVVNPKETKENEMKGCMIKSEEISIKDICDCLGNIDKYNWLITNIECYPRNEKIIEIFNNEYCWIKGKDLMKILKSENFQWIWGVFSAFSHKVKLSDVLNYSFPYADGYKGFWKNPISIQHPLAKMEIVAWDGSIILVISKENQVVETIMKRKTDAKDLESYNMD